MTQPKDVEEEKIPPPSLSTNHLDLYEMNRAIFELREKLEHERYRRYALSDSLRKHRKDREAKRAQDSAYYALAQLQVKRDIRSLVKELATPRRRISPLCRTVSSLRVEVDGLELERKSLMKMVERGDYLYRRKRTRTKSTGGDSPRKT